MAYVVSLCSQTSPVPQTELLTKLYFPLLTMGHTFLQFFFVPVSSVSNRR